MDGTELDKGYQEKNNYYLKRTYHRGEENEFVKYHRSVLEAKLYLGNNLICNIATEPIENSEEYNKKEFTEEAIKQDCESKAFIRLAGKLKKNFPRLPVCIAADALYVSQRVINTCRANGWDYIIRYKEGSAPLIEEEYQATPEKNTAGKAEYINGIVYAVLDTNVLKYAETKIVDGEEKTTTFAWITSIKITQRNAEKIANAGRCRWKIENQGFNRQKRWQGNIEHACSFHEKAQKNHYLMEQISDFIKQLYEYFFLEKNEIRKTQKNISSELLASFGRQLTREDISTCDTHGVPIN
ncbi:MAG: transposase [Lachnospiraceae bacterium]|nr:transposase [Lachnospiraceae bacterium]